ncbi:sulfotransferase 2B1-like isoform X2 [Pseudophryne corroboree]
MSEKCIDYKGIRFPHLSTSVEGLTFLENEFQAQDNDLFNITYPKSGTTWMIEILSLIHNNGDPTWNKTVPNWGRIPWLESPGTVQRVKTNADRPHLFTSHLQRKLLKKALSGSKAKVIYTIREPKDVVVSLLYFAKMSVFYEEPETFDQFLKDYLSGALPYGSWFDHVKGWMEMLGKENFMFQTYNDLQMDLRGSVVKLCKFLGKELDERALDSVVENASFQNMKENKMANFTLLQDIYMDHEKSPFIRKGIIGDWKNHFTVDQVDYFKNIYKKEMQNFNVVFPWDTIL